MITKLKEILGDYGTVKKCPTVDKTISDAYFIEFNSRMSDLMCTVSIDYPTYWKMKIKKSFPYKNIEYHHHYGRNSATMWIDKTIKDERKEKLKKLNND